MTSYSTLISVVVLRGSTLATTPEVATYLNVGGSGCGGAFNTLLKADDEIDLCPNMTVYSELKI